MSASSVKFTKYTLALLLLTASTYFALNYFGVLGEKIPSQEQANSTSSRASSGTSGARGKGTRPSPPVRVVAVTKGLLPNQLTAIGTVNATETVNVMSRINGELISVHFLEGARVKAGDILFKIDPTSYEIALSQAQGQLLKDKANLDNAKADLDRFIKLQNQGGVSEQNIATQRSLIRQLEGTVKTSQALFDKAALELSYTEIKAPIDGMTSLVDISVGNFVQSNTQILTTLTKTEPIDILFNLPQRHIAQLQQATTAAPINIEVWDGFLREKLAEAIVVSMNNQIDTATGTIQLKAQSSNAGNSLFPNQFVNVKVNVSEQQDVLILPFTAIQHGSEGPFVWKVVEKQSEKGDKNNKLQEDSKENNKDKENGITNQGKNNQEVKLSGTNEASKSNDKAGNSKDKSITPTKIVQKIPVELGHRHQESVVVLNGVSEGDLIVSDGVDKLTIGAIVTIVDERR